MRCVRQRRRHAQKGAGEPGRVERRARRAVVAAYEDAIKSYTKDNKDAKAKTAAEELKAFEERTRLTSFGLGRSGRANRCLFGLVILTKLRAASH